VANWGAGVLRVTTDNEAGVGDDEERTLGPADDVTGTPGTAPAPNGANSIPIAAMG